MLSINSLTKLVNILLLHIHRLYGFSGDIRINGNLRDVKTFKPNVAFITQDTTLQPFLTVKEAIHFAANLKIGSQMNTMQRRERVNETANICLIVVHIVYVCTYICIFQNY